jgi:hypothetical protein
MNKNILAGTYDLKSHGTYGEDGVFVPTSDFAHGQLYYGDDGYLSILIRFGREFNSPKDIFGYVGRYKIIDEGTVEHHFEVATNAKQNNTVENRTYKVDAEKVVLGVTWPSGRRFEAVWLRKR